MKPIVRTGARLLLAYFVALPVLFSFHAFLHQDHVDRGLEAGLEITQDSDCGICDLFHSQTAVLTISLDQDQQTFNEFFQLQGTDNTLSNTPEVLHLRGPPIS